MARESVNPSKYFRGKPVIPGDKSISHRGLIFGAMAKGKSEVLDILQSEDVQSTAQCLRELGVNILSSGRSTIIDGVGMSGFKNPEKVLNCGNSGTTIRLLMGLVAGQKVSAKLTGDASLVKRPMKRVAEPLRKMGAAIEMNSDNYAPLSVEGGNLQAVDYELKVASAQIKSAIILAALSAKGTTRITGQIASRDHTERLLGHYGAEVIATATEIKIPGEQELRAAKLKVPSDPSTAAFWMAAAALIPGAELELENILLNPTRTGFIRVLQKMGAQVTVTPTSETPEPVGNVTVKAAKLRGFHLVESDIPALIDEIPILAILASQADGESTVAGAEELRVKESDRLEAIAVNLRAMGVKIDLKKDGFTVHGPQKLSGTRIESFHDHRIAMAFSIAALIAEGTTEIENSECVAISYPDFYRHLSELTSHAD